MLYAKKTMACFSLYRYLLGVFLGISVSAVYIAENVADEGFEDVGAVADLDQLNGGIDYLSRYCYMEKRFRFGGVSDLVGIQSAIRNMQKVANIALTGRLDSGTLFTMRSPRCGMCDAEGKDPNITVYKSTIKYNILNYPSLKSLMAPQQVKKDIAIAFRLWSDVIPVTFEPTEKYNETDITISFGALRHGPIHDVFFDGNGGAVAHVFRETMHFSDFFSGFSEIHFDDDEIFTRQQHFGMNLLYEAAHQIGHVLGLSHTGDKDSIMWPYHRGFVPGGLELNERDIQNVQEIHGVREGYQRTYIPTALPATNSEPQPVSEETQATCPEKFATAVIKGELHLLQGDRVYLYKLNPLSEYTVVTSPMDGYQINKYLKGLHINQDLAYTKADGNTIFIRGQNYWVYDGTRLLPDHPKKIKPLYRGIPKNTKAAFHDKYDGITYFFKGDRFWRYNDKKQRLAGKKKGFPLSDEFDGLPANITAAFSDGNGYRYMLKGQQVWLYRSGSSKLQKGYPKVFPRPNCQ